MVPDNVSAQADKCIEYSLYILRIFSNSENFYKIGISKNVRSRIGSIKYKSGYEVEIIENFSFPLEKALLLEITLLEKFEFIKYNPLIKFDGHTECISENPFLYISEQQIKELATI